ncbi:hypothetical protein QTP86_033997, partial [Hemibagrus guttatus]
MGDTENEGRGDSDEFEKTKCPFACKYCKKAFGTHTSLRRHERRIHERRLLPRGVRQKVVNLNGVQVQHSSGATETSSNTQHSDEGRQEEEYMVDISSNISENLSFYIDGKIISTSAVSNCEVMELNSATAVIGLDAFIVNPAQITQALKIESIDGNMTSDLSGQSSGRRRTSTPPLLPQIKTELESESILTTPSPASEGTGGRSCNQQPLDLSSAVGKRDSEVLADCVLDLSMSRKGTESDPTGCLAFQTSVRKTKPSSSMLEKVLLSQYAVANVPTQGDENARLPTVAVSESVPDNPESVGFELPPPAPPELNATTSLPNVAALHTASTAQPLSATPESTEIFLSAAQTSVTNQDLHPICSTAQSSSPVALNTPVELSVGNPLAAFNMSLPNWLNSAPGSVTHALIPTTPTLSLQGPQFLTDAPVCELAQRTLVIDSVLSPEAHLISPVLVNQSNISSLSFSPNVVVIEYTVALESSNATPVPQTNAVHSLFDKTPPDHTEAQELQPSELQTANIEPSVPELPEAGTVEAEDHGLDSSTTGESLEHSVGAVLSSPVPNVSEKAETTVEAAEHSSSTDNLKVETSDISIQHKPMSEEQSPLPPLCKRFMCNACNGLFQSMKGLTQHIGEHSDTWPYKCEFCVQLFESDTGLFEHRSSYHGIGKIYACRICSKEFAFLCNLEQHHRDLHPGQECSHTEVENGKLRPENHNSPVRAGTVTIESPRKDKYVKSHQTAPKLEADNNYENTTEELYTTIKIMASEGVKPKVTDVRLGSNQHYPSFKPPPFPYHNRTPVSPTTTTATNFTTHNIPQTFSTTVRCTKCGRGFDNMPELHKHILACANASDKKRYTPKKNPIPLKQFAKVQSGVLLPARGVNLRQNISQKLGHPKKLHCHESEAKTKLSTH